MSHKLNFMKYFLLGIVVVLIVSCSRKGDKDNGGKQDSLTQMTRLSDQNLNGTFEYSEPIDDGYLYFKIEMGKEGDSLKGQLWGGVYLAKSEAGGYTNPNVLTSCVLKGVIKEEMIEMQLTETKTERMEEDAPDLLGMMNFPELDAPVTATIWSFNYENGALVSQNGLLMPDGKTPVKFYWEKIK